MKKLFKIRKKTAKSEFDHDDIHTDHTVCSIFVSLIRYNKGQNLIKTVQQKNFFKFKTRKLYLRQVVISAFATFGADCVGELTAA